jgi:hypothetical protein
MSPNSNTPTDSITIAYNEIQHIKIEYFTQQFSSWFLTKNLDSDAEGIVFYITVPGFKIISTQLQMIV